MIKRYIPAILFLVLFLVTVVISADYATSVVPGWDTTIYPPFLFGDLPVTVMLLLNVIFYFKAARRNILFNWKVVIIHLIATIILLLLCQKGDLLFNYFLTEDGIGYQISAGNFISATSRAVFFVMQFLMGFYFGKVFSRQTLNLELSTLQRKSPH